MSEAEHRLRAALGRLSGVPLLRGSRVSGEARRLRRQLEEIQSDTATSDDEIWASVELARHQDRPYTLDYVGRILDDWVELHGDRGRADDGAIVAGIGKLDGRTVALVGHQKGREVKERVARQFGMAHPEGYIKAMRVMDLADRFGFPLVSFIDTPGAYPGVAAEQHGQGGAIARSQAKMLRLNVPTVACVIGEGGSGGAVAIAVSDRVLMQANAIYSVISPEGCAEILWRDRNAAKQAAAAFKPDAIHSLELGVIDGIVPEPPGGAQNDPDAAAAFLRAALLENLDDLAGLAPVELRRRRRGEISHDGRFCLRQRRFSPFCRDFSTASTGFSTEFRMVPGTSRPAGAGLERLPPVRWRSSQWFCSQAFCGKPAHVAKLEAYKRKRDPGKTPEPFGGESGSGRPIFVVQRHDARRLHYDFRLERDGVLLSWAVPKGVPLEPGARALAVHVEDHPLSYAGFAGEIPAGQYGAGTVEVWDHGTYELVEEKDDGQQTVRLHGDRLQGVWTLVPAHLDGKEENWLLIRRRDGDEPAGAAEAQYSPMLATLSAELPSGGDWLYEVKWDGYRALAYVRGGDCELVSRNRNDLTARFPAIAKAVAAAVKTPSAVLDGEVVALDDHGRPSFSAMQRGAGTLVYYAFDLLEADGVPLVGLALAERRDRLRALLDRRCATVRFSDSFDDGEALFHAAVDQKLEGIMAKRAGSKYAQGKRTRDWLKVKTHGRQEFVVAGYTRGEGRRADSFGSLVLAVNEGGELRYVGNVGTGFDGREIDRLLGLLRPLERPTSPFSVAPKMPRVRKGDVVWVEPRLVAEVEFSEWTHDGRVRQPSYKGLHDDKPAAAVRKELPPDNVVRKGKRELNLSNLDKLFWTEEGITKGDLLDYYRAVAPALVPHLKSRPFTMRRYPDGAAGKAFFQKDAPKHMPDWIPTFRALVSTRSRPPSQKWVELPLVNDELALLWMVNMGCIDMNTWYSRIDKPDRPDFVLFDLDPTPEVPWAQTIEVALLLRQLLDGLELASFPKTSGGKGFHVLVPLDRRSTYEDSRAFAEHVAGAIARTHPKLATTEWSKTRRRGVLIDANQNGEGKTIASAYSVRPHPGAPVSTPLTWPEVETEPAPQSFTMPVVLERIEQQGDLHAALLTTRQSLSKALRKLSG